MNLRTDAEVFGNHSPEQAAGQQVQVFDLDKRRGAHLLNAVVYLDSSLFGLVLSGSARLQINFKEYEVNSGSLLLLTFGHFFRLTDLSPDFRCRCLYIGKPFIDEMYSSAMLYKRVKYGVKMHATPALSIMPEHGALLLRRMAFAEEVIAGAGHRYQQEMILQAVLIFLLDLSHILETESLAAEATPLSRQELLLQSFIELLAVHYKAQHHVEFYADQLHITPHYLTLVVKRQTGQTVSDFIGQLLYNEARQLLQQPQQSIQQIAEELNFSDQSAFGKFFKRKAGLPPQQFRKEVARPHPL